jgi:hypothetical protein
VKAGLFTVSTDGVLYFCDECGKRIPTREEYYVVEIGGKTAECCLECFGRTVSQFQRNKP